MKGYEFKKNRYLLLSDEDIDSVRVPSPHFSQTPGKIELVP